MLERRINIWAELATPCGEPVHTLAPTVYRTWPLFELQITRNATTNCGETGSDHLSMLLHVRISLLITDGFGEEVLRRDLSASASLPNTFSNAKSFVAVVKMPQVELIHDLLRAWLANSNAHNLCAVSASWFVFQSLFEPPLPSATTDPARVIASLKRNMTVAPLIPVLYRVSDYKCVRRRTFLHMRARRIGRCV